MYIAPAIVESGEAAIDKYRPDCFRSTFWKIQRLLIVAYESVCLWSYNVWVRCCSSEGTRLAIYNIPRNVIAIDARGWGELGHLSILSQRGRPFWTLPEEDAPAHGLLLDHRILFPHTPLLLLQKTSLLSKPATAFPQ